jgi:dipeptidyl-peptidase-4
MNKRLFLLVLLSGLLGQWVYGQQPTANSDTLLDQIPGYEKAKEIRSKIRALSGGGRVSQVSWSENGFLNFSVDRKKLSLNLNDFSISDFDPANKVTPPKVERVPRKSRVARAQQRTVEISPDKKWKATFRDNNVWLVPGEDNTAKEIQVTTTGNERFRFGTCCWVYGEELDQDEAMWWSPDGNFLVFYEVDENHMRDYHLTTENTGLYTELKTVRYPKAGEPNPKVALLVYDMNSGETERIQIPGEPTQYIFDIRFTPDGKKLLFNRTNRHQNILDVFNVDLSTCEPKLVLTEEQESWQKNSPTMQFLEDSERFVWETESNGWRHFQLRHLDGRLLNPLSQVAEYPCERIEKIDEEGGYFYYTAYSDENPYNVQLHRVGLDGSGHVRITSAKLNHTSVRISPRNDFVLATREDAATPPATVVYDAATGKEVAMLNEGSDADAKEMGLTSQELFSFTANDGETTIWGILHKPSNFDPEKKYPLLIDVYGGPESRGLTNRYSVSNPSCEMGYLIAKIGNRGTVGRGKKFESATYLKLGVPDLDDQAEGVKFLTQRAYVDGDRVGIFGHSYGGYMSALALLRYPDVFQVAVSGAPVTDWKNYDTVYTERYMRTPKENSQGYEEGSCATHADQLKGRLLLVHGLIDDNVHPSNTWQLIKQLQNKNKRFDLMVYPGYAHGIGSTYNALRWEYFYRHLKPVVEVE